MRLLFDIETGPHIDRKRSPFYTAEFVHCIVAVDLDTNEEHVFRPERIAEGVAFLESATFLAGHNIAGYDLPVLQRLGLLAERPKFLSIVDTLAWGRASHPTMKDEDFAAAGRRPLMPKNLFGRHSLESWAWRLGVERKVEHEDWTQFSEAMLHRCRTDVALNVKLFRHLEKKGALSLEAAAWETEFAWILQRQERHGINFDVTAATVLYGQLREDRDVLDFDLRKKFGWWWAPNGVVTAKRDNKKRGIAAGESYTKIKRVDFNPGSRDHVARVLKLQGWKPRKFTASGKPQMDESVLAEVAMPEARALSEYFLLEKRIGQVANGEKAWLKLVTKDGRIHGRVESTGARTSRCAHYSPNMAQVPKAGSPYGVECRSCFLADRGHVLVGADASGLELRMLAHYMRQYDGGEFGRQVHEGDPHTYLLAVSGAHCEHHRDATPQQRLECTAGPNGKNLCRERQKTTTYAFLYGAGDMKLASVMNRPPSYGTRMRRGMKRRIGAKELDDRLKSAFRRGYVKLLDGRHAPTNSQHDTLNTLLQGSGAVLMKYALVLADQNLKAMGLRPIEEGGTHYEFVLNVHDEWQVTCLEEWAATIGKALVLGIIEAGKKLGVRVPLAGEWKQGKTWADTH